MGASSGEGGRANWGQKKRKQAEDSRKVLEKGKALINAMRMDRVL